jgi:hypothetical protein
MLALVSWGARWEAARPCSVWCVDATGWGLLSVVRGATSHITRHPVARRSAHLRSTYHSAPHECIAACCLVQAAVHGGE